MIPYIEEIDFPKKPLRTRRDKPRFLTLIETIAVLHQFQRQRITKNGTEYICADFEDYAVAYHLGQKLLFRTVQGISPNAVKIVEAVWALAEDRSRECNQDATEVEITRRQVEQKIKWERKTVYKYLDAADKDGYLDIDKPGPGKPWKIKVVKKPDQKPKFLLSPDDLYEKFKAKQAASGLSKPVQRGVGQANLLLSHDLT